MASSDRSERSRKIRKDNRRRSRRVEDHLGHIINLSVGWRKARRFLNFDADEVRNIAFIEAERLLREKFKPDKGSATTFLSRFLIGRVEYRILRDSGLRKRPEGWLSGIVLDPTPRQREPKPEAAVDLADLIAAAHPDIRETMRRLSEGVTLERIAIECIPPLSFESPSELDQAIEETKSELLDVLRTELRRLNR